MTEKIVSIKDTSFAAGDKYKSYYDGFVVTTDKQTIKLGIGNDQSCCEDWGYFMTNDNIEDFIGAKFLSVEIVDDCLVKEKLVDGARNGNTMFVNINTSLGTLQFTAYNDHNGYYSHKALVVSEKFNYEQYL